MTEPCHIRCWWVAIGLGNIPHSHKTTHDTTYGDMDVVTMLNNGEPWRQLSLEQALAQVETDATSA